MEVIAWKLFLCVFVEPPTPAQKNKKHIEVSSETCLSQEKYE